MNGDRKFVLDANVFIEAKNRYYGFDFAPKFWTSLTRFADEDLIVSIDHVKEEIAKGKDELAAWIENEFSSAFNSTDDPDISRHFRKIMEWAQSNNQFSMEAKSEFARIADGWLVAYAKEKGFIIVTQETHKPDIARRIPIPNVCEAFGVVYIDTFEMIRKLGIRFD